jgi:hypothetical protein
MKLEFFNLIPLLKKLVKHFFRFFLGSVFKLAQPSFFFSQAGKMRPLIIRANRSLKDFIGRFHRETSSGREASFLLRGLRRFQRIVDIAWSFNDRVITSGLSVWKRNEQVTRSRLRALPSSRLAGRRQVGETL